MTAKDFSTTITVDQPGNEVFDAINNVGAWWHGTVSGAADKVNDEFEYRMKDMHYSKQKVVELIPAKKVVWLVTESNLSFTNNKSEWTGTKIRFDISEQDGKTQLRFTHEGLTPAFECYGGCSNGWEQLITRSLYSLLTKGKGVEVFG